MVSPRRSCTRPSHRRSAPRGSRRSRRALSTLRVASTNGDGNSFTAAVASGRRGASTTISAARPRSRRCRFGEAEQRVELGAGERHAFGGSLHFDEATVAVITTFMSTSARRLRGSRGRASAAVDHADGDRGTWLGDRVSAQRAVRPTGGTCRARDPAAADRGGAVPPSACSTSQSTVICTSGIAGRSVTAWKRTPDQPLDLLRAPALLPLASLPDRHARPTSRAASSTRR